jgi:hypothetical protein
MINGGDVATHTEPRPLVAAKPEAEAVLIPSEARLRCGTVRYSDHTAQENLTPSNSSPAAEISD